MKNFEEYGIFGEKHLRYDLDRFGVAHLPIDQDQSTYAQQFQGVAKRPDSLILLGAARFAAIEVKTKRPGFWAGPETACVGLNRTELEKLAEFELLSGIPVFLAFYDNWNAGYVGAWRIVRLSALKYFREFDDYVAIDINSLPAIRNRGQLMALLLREVAR